MYYVIAALVALLWSFVSNVISGIMTNWVSELISCKVKRTYDTLWERFLPTHCQDIIARSDSTVVFTAKQELYYNSPILLDGGKMSFALDRRNAKTCYMLGARGLSIVWGSDTDRWIWISHPDSRFSEVAQLLEVYWLDIRAKTNTLMLSPQTMYIVYLVFKNIPVEFWGFNNVPIKASVGYVGAGRETTVVYLESKESPHSALQKQDQLPYEREDGWMEIKMGEIFIDLGDDAEVDMQFREVEMLGRKSGLIIEGIELRPKNGT